MGVLPCLLLQAVPRGPLEPSPHVLLAQHSVLHAALTATATLQTYSSATPCAPPLCPSAALQRGSCRTHSCRLCKSVTPIPSCASKPAQTLEACEGWSSGLHWVQSCRVAPSPAAAVCSAAAAITHSGASREPARPWGRQVCGCEASVSARQRESPLSQQRVGHPSTQGLAKVRCFPGNAGAVCKQLCCWQLGY